MKIKVVFGDVRMVVPVGKETDKVSRLILDINKRLQAHLGDPSIRVRELSVDGFIINPNDTISDVLSDGWVVSGSDYKTWVAEQTKLCTTTWSSISGSDFVDDARPFIEIGKHKHNKLYIQFGLKGRTNTITRLELFDTSDLESFGKAGKPLIAREAQKEASKGIDRFSEASFVVEKGVVIGVELTIKTTSDFRPEVQRIWIHSQPTLGLGKAEGQKDKAIETVQASAKGKPTKKYDLPATKSEGKTLEQVGLKTVPKGSDIKEIQQKSGSVSTGTSVIEMKQKEPVQADQSWYEDKKGFLQFIYSNITFLNKTEKKIVITEATAEYMDKGNQWVACDSVSLGHRQGLWYYSWGRDPKGFSISPTETEDIAVRAEIRVQAANYDKNRWVHHSLPNPLQIRITINDADGGKSSVVVQYENDPIPVPTKDSKKKDLETDDTKQMVMFIQADDVDAEARLVAHITIEKSERWGNIVQFGSNISSNGKYLYDEDLRKLVWQATKEKKEEINVAEASEKNEKLGTSVNTTALVDLKESWVYALKVELKTPTSSTVEYFPIP